LTAPAAELELFATQEPNDVAYLRSFIGPEATEAVQQLARFHYVHWVRGQGWAVRETVVGRPPQYS
jgi:hypothetical protein